MLEEQKPSDCFPLPANSGSPPACGKTLAPSVHRSQRCSPNAIILPWSETAPQALASHSSLLSCRTCRPGMTVFEHNPLAWQCLKASIVSSSTRRIQGIPGLDAQALQWRETLIICWKCRVGFQECCKTCIIPELIREKIKDLPYYLLMDAWLKIMKGCQLDVLAIA
jgi:hypothetical protein